jgi:hypothetical protein
LLIGAAQIWVHGEHLVTLVPLEAFNPAILALPGRAFRGCSHNFIGQGVVGEKIHRKKMKKKAKKKKFDKKTRQTYQKTWNWRLERVGIKIVAKLNKI